MNDKIITNTDKKKLIDWMGKEKSHFSSGEIRKFNEIINKEITYNDFFEWFQTTNQYKIFDAYLAFNERLQMRDKLISFIVKEIAAIPWKHNIALKNSKLYCNLCSLLPQKYIDKLHTAYYFSQVQTYLFWAALYFSTAFLAAIPHLIYLSYREKKFNEFVDNGILDSMISFVVIFSLEESIINKLID